MKSDPFSKDDLREAVRIEGERGYIYAKCVHCGSEIQVEPDARTA